MKPKLELHEPGKYMKPDSMFKWLLVFQVFIVINTLALVGLGIWVAWHFISKLW